ncbi:MAG: hypothetical protein E7584_06435 [Ruminococcaceae bacterium]|nr:hypothetical protein [Oscillospiraceae bacterium]
MRHYVKRALCLLVSLSILLTLASILTVSTTAVIDSPEPMIAIGDKFMIVQTASGEIWGWGDNASGVLGNVSSPETGTNITSPTKIDLPNGVTSVSISAGTDHVLMLGSDGNVYAWGNNEYGQLGVDNDGLPLSVPTCVTELEGKNMIAIAAGQRFSLALSDAGDVYSFGLGDKLQLGYELAGGVTHSATPSQILDLDTVFITQISAGIASLSATDIDGKTYLWGSTQNYLLGTDNQSTPAAPFALPSTKTTTPIVATSLSSTHSAFLQSDGTVGFMGLNNYGQYGNGTTNTNLSTAFKVTDTSALGICSIATSEQQTVLLSRDGTVYTAGARIPNDESSAGNTFATLFENAPAATAIAAGYQNGAMLAQDGSVWTWGDNSRGQLGNGSVGESKAVPVKVCKHNGSNFDIGQAPTIKEVPLKFKTSVPAPTYAIVIPSTINVGELRQTDATDPDRNSFTKFTVSAQDVANLYGEKEIQISVSTKNENGVFSLQDGNGNVLPFDLLTTQDSQTPMSSGDILTSFTEDGSVDAWIRIDQSKITKSGIYNGVLVFSYSLNDINEEE